MKYYITLKDKLPYNDGRKLLEGKTFEPVKAFTNPTDQKVYVVVQLGLKKYQISSEDIASKIKRYDEGEKFFDGNIADTIARLAAIQNPSLELQEAVKALQAMEKGMEILFQDGLASVRFMAEKMNCQISDITKGM